MARRPRWIGSSSAFASGRRQSDIQVAGEFNRVVHQSLATGSSFLTTEYQDDNDNWVPSAYPIHVKDLGTKAAPIDQIDLGADVPQSPFQLNGEQILVYFLDQVRRYAVRRFEGGDFLQTEVVGGVVVVKGDPFSELAYLPQRQHARQARG